MTEQVKHAGGRPRERNWADAKALYVRGVIDADGTHKWYDLAEIGQKFGIASIRRTAASEKWKAEREAYQTELAKARQEKRVELLAARSIEFDARALQTFDDLLGQVRKHLSEVTDAGKKLDAQTLARLVATARIAHQGGRLAMGDTTEITRNVGTVTHEFDLSNLSDEELATMEFLRSKMQGLPAGQTAH